MRLLLAPLFILGAALEGSAEGVVATGIISRGGSAYFVTHDHDTIDAARARALSDCRASATECRIEREFTDTCVGVVQPRNAALQLLHDETRESLNERLPAHCPADTPCNYHVWCDSRAAMKWKSPEIAPAVSNRYGYLPAGITSMAAGAGVLLLLVYAIYLEVTDRRVRRHVSNADPRSPLPIDKPSTTAPSGPLDTAGAQEALRKACPHLEGYYSNKNPSRFDDIDAIRRAGIFVAEARAKDPNASILYRTKDGDEIDLSANAMAGEILYLGAQQIAYNSDPAVRVTAVAPLQQAITYVPDSVPYRRELARLYLNLDMISEAAKVAEAALSIDPADVETRKLVDEIAPINLPAVKQSYIRVGTCLSAAGGLLALASPLIAYAMQSLWTSIHIIYFGALPLLALGRIMRTARGGQQHPA